MNELAATMLRRGPEILAEATTAGHPRLTELYDEADDWRLELKGPNSLANPLQVAMWRAAHAVVMAVSAVWYEPPGDNRHLPYFMEKMNEAKIALDRVRRLSSSA